MAIRRSVLAVCAALALLLAAAVPAATAAEGYDDDTVIVKFKPETPAGVKLRVLSRPAIAGLFDRLTSIDAYVVTVRRDPGVVAARLSRHPLVEYAEPNYVLSTQATPDDPLFPDEYGLHNTGRTGGTADADIDAPEGWDLAGLTAFPSRGGVEVGVVDTGISTLHPDLLGKLSACGTSYSAGLAVTPGCEDDNGHGTHVAGTISANTNNGGGVAAVAFDSPLVICKALATPLGTGLTSDIARCIEWTFRQGARIISMSLGGGPSETLRRTVEAAYAGGRGALLIAAAGNDGDSTRNYPAAYPEVVSVAATDDRDRRASFSNTNPDVEIAAPGVDTVSTYLGATYATLSGTSMATPHVAGVAAILAGLDPTASAATLRSRLTAAVDDLGTTGRDPSFGFGRTNLCKAAGGSCAYTAGG